MWVKLYLVLFIITNKSILALEVGDECKPNNEVLEGVCTQVTKCEVALRAIEQKSHHPFLRCTFDGELEVVCCPQETTNKLGPDSNNRMTERKSERECKKLQETSSQTLDLHIIGGEVSNFGEFPHMVALGYENENGYSFDCGGALVSPTYVLTAAHCIVNLERKEPKIIRAGVVALGDPGWNSETDYRVVQNITHPEYKRSAQYNDIALLRLERPIRVSGSLNAACLYTSNDNPEAGLIITGWGKTSVSKSDKSDMLLKTNVWAVPREQCAPHYTGWRKLPRGVIADQLCAGDPQGGHDACQGDSGGPLQMTVGNESVYRLVGVTSFGRGCGSTLPGIYTRVASYVDWIESVVWPN